MLSYRHAFHAGNAADVFKHAVLLHSLDYLKRKEAPFLVVDTHAGAGFYSLTGGYAAQNREWERGVGRILKREAPPPLLARYAALAGEALAGDGRYPGSPALIQKLLRSQDRGVCFELHPADFALLAETLKPDRRFRALREDGLRGLKALLPPPSRRGCVFVDPPYEMRSDYAAVPKSLAEALSRFSTGLYIVWYPLLKPAPGKPEASGASLRETLLGLYSGNRFAVELFLPEKDSEKRMFGSGLAIYNPPFTLREALEESLPALAELLGGWQWRWYS
ncbi:MAG: 23S rRNA (adenine(2030)-N(6))-methyltransferase RlmJ [Treponema sp.]|jgi:23S rRNA (adenine2030-N6)-methyltransferase|nr:23S rRNA (adenine(2030)-N(6))-methyltransferase RlmJ [Treponema sp.]